MTESIYDYEAVRRIINRITSIIAIYREWEFTNKLKKSMDVRMKGYEDMI